MSHDDNIDDPLRGPIKEPDDPVDPIEAAQAESFAELIDQMLDGRDLPPAMASEQRALVEVAGIVRANVREVALAPERSTTLIDEAIARASATRPGANAPALRSADSAPATPGSKSDPEAGYDQDSEDNAQAPSDVTDLGAFRRKRLGQVIPWTVAGVAAAAALILVLIRPPAPTPGPQVAENLPAPSLPLHQQSRPTDTLIGEIPRAHVGHARQRIDMIYADRMAGYRALRLQGSTGGER